MVRNKENKRHGVIHGHSYETPAPVIENNANSNAFYHLSVEVYLIEIESVVATKYNVKPIKIILIMNANLMLNVIVVVLNFFYGRFGHLTLKSKFRIFWVIMWFILFMKFVMFPIFAWWDGVVRMLNYVIWG